MLITIMKDVANMQQFANASIAGFYQTYLQNATETINKIIAQYGILATTALEQLNTQHQIISEESLLNTIDQIRNAQINEEQLITIEKLLELILNNYTMIDTQNPIIYNGSNMNCPDSLSIIKIFFDKSSSGIRIKIAPREFLYSSALINSLIIVALLG